MRLVSTNPDSKYFISRLRFANNNNDRAPVYIQDQYIKPLRIPTLAGTELFIRLRTRLYSTTADHGAHQTLLNISKRPFVGL